MNYCTIDTSVYSISQIVNFNNNWWVVNDTDISKLIENLPPSARIKTFAELKISSDVEEPEIGKLATIFVNLYWNGTQDQTNIGKIPLRTVNLNSNCGILSNSSGKLTDGSFETALTINNTENPLITAVVDNVVVTFDFTKPHEEMKISATGGEIFEGETAIISIMANQGENGICLIDIGSDKYYVNLVDGQANVSISNLNVGKHEVIIKYLGNSNTEMYTNNTTVVVKDKLDPKMNVTIKNENGLLLTVELPGDATGNVAVIVDGNMISTIKITDNPTNIIIENPAYCSRIIEVSYSGDNRYNLSSKTALLNLKRDTEILAESANFAAVDYGAGERGGMLTFTLRDVDGNALSNKTVQVALNQKIYTVKTNELGIGELSVNLESANVYTCALSFAGDENYTSAPLTIAKLTVTKKKTTISASSKTFKAKAKTKTISVTLKTVKNKFNGKTYLKKGKKLTLTVNGKKYSAKTNAQGLAKFTIKLTKKGKFAAKISFAGDRTYNASSKTIKVTIK